MKKRKILIVLISSIISIIVIATSITVIIKNLDSSFNDNLSEDFVVSSIADGLNFDESIDLNHDDLEESESLTEAYEQAELSTESLQTTELYTSSSIDVKSMTESELLVMLVDSVNKTKLYTENLSVNHKKSYDVNIIECVGGSAVVSVVNSFLKELLSPTDEILYFGGGAATDSNGDTISLLLPSDGELTLSMDDITSITASSDEDEIIINVTIVEETVDGSGMSSVNSDIMGPVDISVLDLGVVAIDSAEILYLGSEIEVYINSDGYINNAKYTSPMSIECSLSGIISGVVKFDATQTEIWTLNW